MTADGELVTLGASRGADGRGASAEMTRRFAWLMSLRVVIVTTLLLSALLVQSITGTYFAELNPIYYLVGFTYLLTLVYAVIVSLQLWQGWFLEVQLFGDLIIITGLIYYSGGIDSAFPFLFILPIITASILLERRGGLWIGLVSCVLYGALVALIYNRIIPPATGFLAAPVNLTMNQVYYNLFVRWLGFLAAAFLSIYLAEKLREAGRTLKERSADLESLQVFYEDVINSVNSGLMSSDLTGRIGSLNRAGERILDVTFRDVVGRTVDSVIEVGHEEWERLGLQGTEGVRFERRYVPSRGEERHLEIVASRLYDRAHLHRGFTFVFRDITLLKELEREVRLKERMAAVGEMAAGLAHEIRNPLASVSGSIQLLRGDLELEDEQRTLMNIVVGESERLNRIVEEFLFYARPTPPMPQVVNLRELVEQTTALFRNSSELTDAHSVETRFQGGDLVIQGDSDQLRQVLWNLLRNGAQAMADGGRLVVEVSPSGAGVGMTVEDEGSGFGEHDVDQLWEPFHTSRDRGTGLGLAIVYRIIRDHRGRVQLSNRSPRGACISVWLPRSWTESDAPDGGADVGWVQHEGVS